MNNHYHLLLSEEVEGGITTFIRKLNIGHSKYFNKRHKRSGTLFQGRTKKVLIQTQNHFSHIVNYIHLNPLDYTHSCRNWRERNIGSWQKALHALKEYPWSSYHDYRGEGKFPNVTTTTVFQENYPEDLYKYLKNLDLPQRELSLE